MRADFDWGGGGKKKPMQRRKALTGWYGMRRSIKSKSLTRCIKSTWSCGCLICDGLSFRLPSQNRIRLPEAAALSYTKHRTSDCAGAPLPTHTHAHIYTHCDGLTCVWLKKQLSNVYQRQQITRKPLCASELFLCFTNAAEFSLLILIVFSPVCLKK